MAKLSQKQLEEMAKKRKLDERGERGLSGIETEHKTNVQEKVIDAIPQAKILNDIMGDKNTQLYKYELPEMGASKKEGGSLPFVEPKEYPSLNIRGNASRERQAKPIKFYLLKEIDFILKQISSGNNKTATLNFLVWVGLQTLKGMNQSIDIRIHDETYADGDPIKSFLEDESASE